jgi:hypothetical protein
MNWKDIVIPYSTVGLLGTQYEAMSSIIFHIRPVNVDISFRLIQRNVQKCDQTSTLSSRSSPAIAKRGD